MVELDLGAAANAVWGSQAVMTALVCHYLLKRNGHIYDKALRNLLWWARISSGLIATLCAWFFFGRWLAPAGALYHPFIAAYTELFMISVVVGLAYSNYQIKRLFLFGRLERCYAHILICVLVVAGLTAGILAG